MTSSSISSSSSKTTPGTGHDSPAFAPNSLLYYVTIPPRRRPPRLGETGLNPIRDGSLFADLVFDTAYDLSETQGELVSEEDGEKVVVKLGGDISVCKKRRKTCGSITRHLASGVWNLSREQGNKLLASRFRGDCLYICDWPGCLHTHDGNQSKISLDCVFCPCKEIWGLHSAFCLRQVFGYHYDGEPVVRAYVCGNGHVSGVWTVRPMYA
ncbi:hypothetical protein HHK36_010610 [Tetracentron sinense]|uniref:Uncharacterized protein n=1 Tax=Tetracentron sinense TaxID=13715 RepID=A0A834ZAS4_TETSI|nr:hypothetical protein HHK36_010610 [Tetracentron sinense]